MQMSQRAEKFQIISFSFPSVVKIVKLIIDYYILNILFSILTNAHGVLGFWGFEF